MTGTYSKPKNEKIGLYFAAENEAIHNIPACTASMIFPESALHASSQRPQESINPKVPYPKYIGSYRYCARLTAVQHPA
jgi:hypothetical protein